jgi:hypothetical protein
MAQKTPILFVDFDRTLFDTAKFTTELWKAVARRYDLDTEKAKAEGQSYFSYVGNLYDYDFFAHMRSMTGQSDAAIADAVREDLAGQDFRYADSGEAFAWANEGHDVRILTFGNEPYQRLKLSLTAEFMDLPIMIIREAKGEYLGWAHAAQQGWLVDDKPDQRLPIGFKEINLNRASDLPIAQQSGYVIVNSLKHVRNIL